VRASIVAFAVAAAVAGCAAAPSRAPIDAVMMISANAEWKALIASQAGAARHADTPYGEWIERRADRVILFHGGYGKVAAAGSTQYAIDRWHPRVIVNLGTCGGFGGELAVGDVVLASETIIYDLVEAMGDPDETIADYRTRLDTSRWPARLRDRVHVGPIVSADRDLVPAEVAGLHGKFHASAGDWESGAIAWVAARAHTRVVILRAVSDVVDRSGDVVIGDLAAWQRVTATLMPALLELALAALPELVR
jgi:adenosylhomocysteine nucleosidase